MRRWALIGSFVAWIAGNPASAEVSPREVDFFRPPALAQIQVSPSGKHVAALTTTPDGWTVWTPGSSPTATPLPPATAIPGSFGRFAWIGDDQVLLTSRPGAPWEFKSLPFAESTTRTLTPAIGVHWVRPVVTRLDSAVLIEGYRRDTRGRPLGRWLDVWKVPVGGGPQERLARNPGDIVEWGVDARGRVQAGLALRGTTQELRLAPTEQDPAGRTVFTFDAIRDPAELLAVGEDGRSLWFAARMGRDTRGVYEFDLRAERVRRACWTDPEFDFDGRAWIVGSTLVGLTVERERPEWIPLDSSEAIGQGLPGSLVALAASGTYAVFHERTPPERWVGTPLPPDPQLPLGTVLNSPAATSDLPRPEIRRWTARDGLSLSGHLTLPRTTDETRPPLVMLVHGGPWTRDYWCWSPEAQFLASRGWAVAQANYRGSAGFGWAFQQAGAGQWRRAAQDLMDVARELAQSGQVDARRQVITGASFGGYLSALALTQEAQPFLAAASLGGVFDLAEWWRSTRHREPDFVRQVQRAWLFGSGSLESPHLEIAVRNSSVPMWVGHSRDDALVPIQQSEQFVATLRKAGRSVEWVSWPDGGHTLGTPEQQAERWDLVERFLAKCVGK